MGASVVTGSEAWKIYETLAANDSVDFAQEPARLEEYWRAATMGPKTGPNFWTDAYLGAFAAAGAYTVVTFDRAFRTMRGVNSLILS